MSLSAAQCQLLRAEGGVVKGDAYQVRHPLCLGQGQENLLVIEPQKFDEKILRNRLFLGKNKRKMIVQVVVWGFHLHHEDLTVMNNSVIMTSCKITVGIFTGMALCDQL